MQIKLSFEPDNKVTIHLQCYTALVKIVIRFTFFQTSLFQNKLLDSDNPSSILINTTTHSLSTDLTREPSFFGDGDNAATLRDVNGNVAFGPQNLTTTNLLGIRHQTRIYFTD